MAVITNIIKGGIAKELKLKVGDELLTFNNKPFIDMLDYYYYDGQDSFIMEIKRRGKVIEYEVEKYPHETLGMEFDCSVDITPIRCKNKCKFCFVDQLPKGMRESLYVKDDDYRLSFISGNYITLTNVHDEELARIADMRLSPLYISVHSTDVDVKENLVSNPESLRTLDKMKFMRDNNIIMHAQIVVCESINDGDSLSRTLADLADLAPSLQTVALVPSGLTKHREGLYPLQAVTVESARDTIARVAAINAKLGYTFAIASDEMYLRAELELPSYDDYGEFSQIENGVGLMRIFQRELEDRLLEVKPSQAKVAVSCITGVSFGAFLDKQLDMVREKYPNATIDLCVVINKFFGESITVAGLITGGDIIEQLVGKVASHTIIPSNMLREFTDRFLDNITVSELEKALNTTIHVSKNGGSIVDIIESLI